jgi:hypothetical protein
MTAERKEGATVGRRGFLGALAGLSAGAAALVAPGAVREARAQTTEEERKRARYQETEHVRRFYETNRY